MSRGRGSGPGIAGPLDPSPGKIDLSIGSGKATAFIAVRSRPGRGTTFLLDMPLCDDCSILADTAPPVENQQVILLVENEPAVQLLGRRVLEAGKNRVLVASFGGKRSACWTNTPDRSTCSKRTW